MATLPSPSLVTRFAPSPTGRLHKGHAYSALSAYTLTRETGGRFLVRIEDIDHTRCRSEATDAILEDLAWLGLTWEEPVRIQSEHLAEYADASARLLSAAYLYPCFCTRGDIQREIAAAGQAPHGSEGPLYPGTCRQLSDDERAGRVAAEEPHCLRLDLAKALASCEADLSWHENASGWQMARPELLGDAILVRKDIGTSYHLAVVHDDALQGVTDIVRGVDLLEATHLHRLLQSLLGFPTPRYHHHPLLTDEHGKRLAKRDQAITLSELRTGGISAARLREELGFPF